MYPPIKAVIWKIITSENLKRMNLWRHNRWIAALVVLAGISGTVIAQEATPPAEPPPFSLTIWLPMALADVENEAAGAELTAQIAAFEGDHTDMHIALRVRDEGEAAGAILPTLTSSSQVAPSALPHLSLMRRADLIAAERSGLIYPLPGAAGSLTEDMLPSVEELGRVNGVLYGLPYALETLHLAYQAALEPPNTWRFTDLLDAGFGYAFPAADSDRVNNTLYAQYAALDGDLLVDDDLVADSAALERFFTFFDDAVQAEVIDPSVLAYTTHQDYLPTLITGDLSAGVITSTAYLDALEQGAALTYGAIPTETATTSTVLDGWMWVLTTPQPNAQAAALDWIAFMADASRQATYTQIIGLIPASRSALDGWGSDPAYANFTEGLLRRALLPVPEDGESAAFMRAVQNVLPTVITGEATPEQAAATVMGEQE